MRERPNVLLIVIDALRADHLGCYGYPLPTSPNLDALAEEGVVVDQLFCPGIPTQPSFTTLYTGQHPITHGIVGHRDQTPLAREAPFLPEFLLQAGYTTCALDNLWQARPWFTRGYEFYIDPSRRHSLPMGVTCEELNTRAISWLRAHAAEPFFLIVHYWDTHYPYNPPDRYRDLFYEGNPTDPANKSLENWWAHPVGKIARDTWLRIPEGRITDVEYVVALYDQEIRYVDEGVRDIVTTLDDLAIAEKTIVVVTSDHGESLTEHGIFFDHCGLYDCTLRIPLIARLPGCLPAGSRVSPVIQMSDVAPTLLEALQLPISPKMEGRSYWAQFTGERRIEGNERVISAECVYQAKWCLRNARYKFILARGPDFYGNPPRELYDLRADPREENNIVEEQPDLAGTMERELEAWINERLKALGKSEDPLRGHAVSRSRQVVLK